MTTTVINSVGSASRDYATWALWEAAIAVNMTTTRSNTVAALSSTSTIQFDAGASGSNSLYNGLTVTWSGQERLITAYDGTTKIATIGALNGSSATWSGTPNLGDAFTINAVAYQGQGYNDSEFVVAGNVITISGQTTSASSTITMTAATGQSFSDNANAQTNALYYNAANGVALRDSTVFGAAPIQVTGVSNVFLKRIQARGTSNRAIRSSGTCTINIDQCIFYASSSDVVGPANNGVAITASNTLFHNDGTTNPISVNGNSSVTAEFCTFILAGNTSTSFAVRSTYGACALKNCLVYGFTTVFGASGSTSATTCQTDIAAPPSGFTTQSAANQFVSTTIDFKLKSGAPAQGAATADTNYPSDIVGTARPQGSNWDIGAWELVSGGGGATVVIRRNLSQFGTRVGSRQMAVA